MKPIEIISTDLFEKVRSRFTNLQMGDENGTVTADPAAARFFDFDFAVEGNNLGRVSISINETGNLKIYYSQGITENADSITQTMWYDFLKEMRYFAKRRLMRFDTRDITKGNLDKTDFQYLAQNGNKDPNMTESAMFGSKRTSHRKLENTDLIIRHSEDIDETKPGARSRKIKNLFIQNSEGERFKFPFVYLPGARAMQRHVANGGYPHDDAGKHIIKCCEEILKLSDFGRKVKHSTLNDNAHEIAERAGTKLKQLRHHMECMSKQGYYESWKEAYAPGGDITEIDDATMESYKDAFTVNKFDEALRDVFPLLHSIMQEAGTVDLEDYVSEAQQDEAIEEDASEEDEFAAFESWATALEDGTMETDTVNNLRDLLDQNLTLGTGTEVIEALKGIGIEDKSLEQLIMAKVAGAEGANIELKDVVMDWLEQNNPEVFQQMATPAPAEQPAPAAEPAAAAPTAEPAMAEGDMPDHLDPNLRKAYMMGNDAYKHYKGHPEMAQAAQDKIEKDFPQYAKMWLTGYRDGERFDKDVAEGTPAKNTDVVDRKEKMSRLTPNKPGIKGDLKSIGQGLKAFVKGKPEPVGEGAYYGPEDFQDWLKDATHRVAHGKVADWTELYAELTSDLGFDENKAERIARRIYDHDALAQYRVKASDEPEMPTDDDGEDDDASFLAKLRGQARSGSIKPGVDTGEKDEDSINPDAADDEKLLEPEKKSASSKEIAQSIIGFFDRDKGTWTKGRPGIVAHVKREFGDKAAELATQLIMKISQEAQGQQQFAEMRRLAGLPVIEADDKGAWKKETPWVKASKKDPRGKVTNLSDKARRETEKTNQAKAK
jgi:hypothetical protein